MLDSVVVVVCSPSRLPPSYRVKPSSLSVPVNWVWVSLPSTYAPLSSVPVQVVVVVVVVTISPFSGSEVSVVVLSPWVTSRVSLPSGIWE